MKKTLLFTLLALTPGIANAFPSIDNTKLTPTNVCFTNDQGKIESEVFMTPKVIPDFGPVQYLDASPRDPNRNLFNIKDFGLAKFHWWLFGTLLAQGQRQYAGCVERVKMGQRLLNVSPLMDDPSSPDYATVISVREYTVPFEPIQQVDPTDPTRPPGLFEAIIGAEAALESYNATVYYLGLCEGMAAQYENAVKSQITQLQDQVKKLTKKKRH